MWQKIKQSPIAKWLATLFAALTFGLAAGALARRNAQARAMERRAGDAAAAATGRALERAARATEKAERHKLAAEDRRKAAEDQLDRLGSNDDTLADLVDAWNTDRLRRD